MASSSLVPWSLSKRYDGQLTTEAASGDAANSTIGDAPPSPSPPHLHHPTTTSHPRHQVLGVVGRGDLLPMPSGGDEHVHSEAGRRAQAARAQIVQYGGKRSRYHQTAPTIAAPQIATHVDALDFDFDLRSPTSLHMTSHISFKTSPRTAPTSQAGPPSTLPDIHTLKRLMASDEGYQREDALSSLLASSGEEAKALDWLRQHCRGAPTPTPAQV